MHLLRGKRQNENKMEKTTWEMIRQFNKGKTKVEDVKTKENKRFYSLLPIYRECLVTSQEEGFQHAQWLLWQTSIIIKNALSTPLFLPLASPFLLIAGQIAYGAEYSLWSVGVSRPGCVPSQDFTHPQPSGERGCCGASIGAVLERVCPDPLISRI